MKAHSSAIFLISTSLVSFAYPKAVENARRTNVDLQDQKPTCFPPTSFLTFNWAYGGDSAGGVWYLPVVKSQRTWDQAVEYCKTWENPDTIKSGLSTVYQKESFSEVRVKSPAWTTNDTRITNVITSARPQTYPPVAPQISTIATVLTQEENEYLLKIVETTCDTNSGVEMWVGGVSFNTHQEWFWYPQQRNRKQAKQSRKWILPKV